MALRGRPRLRKSTFRHALKGRLLEGPPGRGPFAGFETPIEQVQRAAKGPKNVRFATPQQHGTAGQIAPSKKHPLPRLNIMAVKDGRLLEGPPPLKRFKGQPKGSKTCVLPRRNGMALRGTPRLRKSTLCHALTAWQ